MVGSSLGGCDSLVVVVVSGCVCLVAKPILYFGYLGGRKVLYSGHVGGSVFAINTSNDRSSREHLVLEAQFQQLTPFTSIVPLNFEAATVSYNPEGFTAPV